MLVSLLQKLAVDQIVVVIEMVVVAAQIVVVAAPIVVVGDSSGKDVVSSMVVEELGYHL